MRFLPMLCMTYWEYSNVKHATTWYSIPFRTNIIEKSISFHMLSETIVNENYKL